MSTTARFDAAIKEYHRAKQYIRSYHVLLNAGHIDRLDEPYRTRVAQFYLVAHLQTETYEAQDNAQKIQAIERELREIKEDMRRLLVATELLKLCLGLQVRRDR